MMASRLTASPMREPEKKSSSHPTHANAKERWRAREELSDSLEQGPISGLCSSVPTHGSVSKNSDQLRGQVFLRLRRLLEPFKRRFINPSNRCAPKGFDRSGESMLLAISSSASSAKAEVKIIFASGLSSLKYSASSLPRTNGMRWSRMKRS